MHYNPFSFIRLYRHSFWERVEDTEAVFCGDFFTKTGSEKETDGDESDSSDDEWSRNEVYFIIKSHLGLIDYIFVAPVIILRLAETCTFFSVLFVVPIYLWSFLKFIVSFWVGIALLPIIGIFHICLLFRVSRIEQKLSALGKPIEIEPSGLDSEKGSKWIKQGESFLMPVYTNDGKKFHSGITFNVNSMYIAIYSPRLTNYKVYIFKLDVNNCKSVEEVMETDFFIVQNRDRISAHITNTFYLFPSNGVSNNRKHYRVDYQPSQTRTTQENEESQTESHCKGKK